MATLAGAAAQTPATLVAGQVIDATSGRPVSESVVTLSAPTGGGPSTAAQRKVLTDGSGRFAFQGLPAGRYSITATRPGYLTGVLGKLAPRGGGAPLQLSDGERVIDLRILMWKHAAVRGRVTDEAGEPVVGARVTALRRAMIWAGRATQVARLRRRTIAENIASAGSSLAHTSSACWPHRRRCHSIRWMRKRGQRRRAH